MCIGNMTRQYSVYIVSFVYQQAENPTLSMTELSKLLGTEWSKMSTEDKEEFVRLAAEDRAR